VDKSIQELERKVLHSNDKIMYLHVMILMSSTSRVIIHASKINNLDWYYGLTWDIMKRLKKKKYKPEDIISAME